MWVAEPLLQTPRRSAVPLFRRILVVCSANVCRSPMVEALLRQRHGASGVHITSAGLAVSMGSPADPVAQQLMAARGIDISGHRSRQVTRELVLQAEVVLVMEVGHRSAVEQFEPSARGRVCRLGGWSGFDVADPYRKSATAYHQALALIDRGIADFEQRLWA